jgi:acetyl-CoA acetyltransferase
MAHDGDNIIPERAGRSMWSIPAAGAAIRDAFERTGLAHEDIDVIEPWIPFAPLEVMVMRSLGFPRDYGRTHCVSPSGGPIARGYPLLATGFYNWHEIVQQLRGHAGPRQKNDARFAMGVSETGNYNECVVDIFERFDGGSAQ